MSEQQLDTVTALAESMARYDAERNGHPWRGWEALYDEGRTHYLGLAGAVLDSGIVLPAADVTALADKWVVSEREADEWGPRAARTGYDCGDELRALVAGGES